MVKNTECVGYLFAYVAHFFFFLRDVWIRTQSASVASGRAIDLSLLLNLLSQMILQFWGPSPHKNCLTLIYLEILSFNIDGNTYMYKCRHFGKSYNGPRIDFRGSPCRAFILRSIFLLHGLKYKKKLADFFHLLLYCWTCHHGRYISNAL
jgi:hypothetical protein